MFDQSLRGSDKVWQTMSKTCCGRNKTVTNHNGINGVWWLKDIKVIKGSFKQLPTCDIMRPYHRDCQLLINEENYSFWSHSADQIDQEP
jgi:hypothetical protein